MSRNTQGVTLIAMAEDERLVGVGRIVEENGAEDNNAGDNDAGQEPEAPVDGEQ